MFVGALPVCFVVEPHAFVNVPVCMNQGPVAIRLIVLPHAFVPGAVGPDLDSMPVLFAVLALTRVHRTVCLVYRMVTRGRFRNINVLVQLSL